MKNLEEANSQFKRVKENIQNFEEVLSKARKLQEQKLILQAGSNYLPIEDIEIIIQKSDAKIEDAKLLNTSIEKLKNKLGYMTKDEIESQSEILQTFKTRFEMIESMPDGTSEMICNQSDDEEVDNEELDDNENVDDNDDFFDVEELDNSKEPDDHVDEEVDHKVVDSSPPELVTKQS